MNKLDEINYSILIGCIIFWIICIICIVVCLVFYFFVLNTVYDIDCPHFIPENESIGTCPGVDYPNWTMEECIEMVVKEYEGELEA